MPRKQGTYRLDPELLKQLKLVSTKYDDVFASQEEVVAHCIRSALHSLAAGNTYVANVLDTDLDPRVDRECFGGLCISCKHLKACKAGTYDGGYLAA